MLPWVQWRRVQTLSPVNFFSVSFHFSLSSSFRFYLQMFSLLVESGGWSGCSACSLGRSCFVHVARGFLYLLAGLIARLSA